MANPGLATEIVDRTAYDNSLARFAEQRIVLPTFAQLAEPTGVELAASGDLAAVDPDAADAANLFRVHWWNGPDRRRTAVVPQYLELPPALTGVEARIVLLLGDSFPMIRAHKVLAAYACLAPRIVTGQFDPTRHRAIWPSTGNYCRGGVAISRIMGCRGVAVLPEGMSRERFEWLEEWVAEDDDIIRTPGSESNVKEIYDRCAEIDLDADNVVFNQFSEFGNYLAHYTATGRAAEAVFEHLRAADPAARLSGWISATGSAGTLAAGDYLGERHGTRIMAVEALECPTLLANGFGAHNIQGIGDKHVPLIHNVMNTDLVAAVSDRSTDALDLLFNSEVGQEYLVDQGVDAEVVASLGRLGFSSICNLIAAIKMARYFGLGREHVLMTVATDGAELYASERERMLQRDHSSGYGVTSAARDFGQHLLGVGVDHLVELTHAERERVFNLGYFTWVEQQGLTVEDFEARRHQAFWRDLRDLLPAWDERIEEFNRSSVVASP